VDLSGTLGNEHVLPWYSQNQVPAVLDALDVGLMPYDCTDPKNLHCVPLKLFDYFSRGIPVVSTPIVHLREYGDLVYLGATANELADAVSQALAEPVESPKRAARIAVARKHSIENLSRPISRLLEEAC
jgi:glycosyltransferase involved in cell wall biosynthesis